MEYNYQPAAPIPSKNLLEGGDDLKFVRPDAPSRCTWKPDSGTKSAPHKFQVHNEKPAILPNVLHAVGNTPLIRLNNIPKSFGIKCEMLAKCEFFNPAGSVKDRIAVRMIEDAEEKGLLKPGDTIIEPTSGNTGLGLAMAAAVKGYQCVIVMPLKMSGEKVNALKALGAKVIRTPTHASFDSPEGLIAVAQKLCRQIPNSIILDQYRNSCNPIAHYEHTAQEILNQCQGRIDAVVCGAGTGGTICGIGRKIKEVIPTCKVIAADPFGSSLSLPEELNRTDVTFYEVEGVGYDFIPTVLDRSVVDKWFKTNDEDSLRMARRLIKEEALFCGGSSGAVMCVALEVAQTMNEGDRLVVVLPDGMRNYMSKFISDPWMKIRGFECDGEENSLWWTKTVVGALSLREPPTISASAKCSDAFKVMKEKGLDYIFPVIDGNIIGVVTSSKILSNIIECKNDLNDNVDKFIDPVRTVDETVPLGRISFIAQTEKYILVKCLPKGGGKPVIKFAQSSDLLDFIINCAQ